MKKSITCPRCGEKIPVYANPAPTVDVVIYDPNRGVVIIERRNEPYGYAIPGGFIDEGEQAECAAVREMREETSLDINLLGLLGVYSGPRRDPRRHTISTVFVGSPKNPDALHAGDDAATAKFYQLNDLPEPLAFDHQRILQDFAAYLEGRRRLAPIEPLQDKD